MKNTNKKFSPLNIILIRHASIIKDVPYDLLTDSGKKYSENLPNILKDQGYNKIDFIYYVNIDRRDDAIKRCYNTLKYLEYENKEPIKWDKFPDFNSEKFIGKTIVICYVSQSLYQFPIKPYNTIAYYTDKNKTVELYEKIIVVNYIGGKLVKKEIKTGDKSFDKQNL